MAIFFHRLLVFTSLLILMGAAACAQRRGPRGMGPDGDQYPPIGNSDTEKRILQTLTDAARAGELYENVPAADGRMLRLLTEAANAKSVVEIGTSTGLSGLWFCMALDRTGGRLTTFEMDSGRAATARAHFRKAGVERLVTVVEGDAHRNIGRLKEPIDVVFLDAEKSGYVDYLKQLLPLVRPGGLILAHNIGMVSDYVAAATSDPNLDTVFYQQGGGLGVTLKKR